MEQNDLNNYDKNNFIFILIFSGISIILFLIYLSLVIIYIIKNYHTKKLCIYWLDYCCLIFTGIIFIIIYLINIVYNNKRINNPIELSRNFFSIAIILSLTTMCVTIIGSLFFDAISAIQLSLKMKEIKKINDMDFFAVSQRFKDIKINNILKMKYNYKYYIIFAIISIIYIILCFFAYRDTNKENLDGLWNLSSYFNYLLRYYHLFTLLLLLISIIFMNINKKSLLKKHYYNPNRISQKIYDVHFSQIVYFTDVISFKLVADLIMNIPAFFFLCFGKFNTFTLICSEISIFLFIVLGGSEYLVLDRDNFIEKMSKKIKFFFCFKKLDFHFGEKDQRANLDIFRINYSDFEDESILDDLSVNAIRNIESIFLEFSETGSDGSVLGLNSTGILNSTISTRNLSKTSIKSQKFIDFQIVPEFYLIQKLMMIFFITNKKVYESANDNIDDNFFEIKKFGNERKSKRKTINLVQKKDSFNLDRMSKISLKDNNQINTCVKISQNDIFTSIEEKELLEELKKKLNITNEKYAYKIESLFSTELFELYPYFQMKINSIIKSLNPARNIKIFNKFIGRNNNVLNGFQIVNIDNRLSVRSYKSFNDKNNFNYNITIYKENKKELEKNLYYTHDLFLMYEIYDQKDFLNYDELHKIITEYNSYLISVVKNMNYSFLPLILGIFNLQIYDSNKIIILYRNPLYFTNFYKFSHWINFYITEEPEKIKVSSLFNDVIDVNEIEIKNTLELNDSDYEEVKKNLNNDYNFLKKVQNIYPIIHLFIGDENSNGGSITNLRLKRNKNQFNENSILGELSENNEIGILDMIDNNSSLSNMNVLEDFNDINTNENSLFDKEYYYLNGNDIRTIKIYFTNLFRKDCELSRLQGNKYNQVNTDTYCQYLQDQLINYLNKNTMFNDYDKNDESIKSFL